MPCIDLEQLPYALVAITNRAQYMLHSVLAEHHPRGIETSRTTWLNCVIATAWEGQLHRPRSRRPGITIHDATYVLLGDWPNINRVIGLTVIVALHGDNDNNYTSAPLHRTIVAMPDVDG